MKGRNEQAMGSYVLKIDSPTSPTSSNNTESPKTIHEEHRRTAFDRDASRLTRTNGTNQVHEVSDSESDNELRTNGILTMPSDDIALPMQGQADSPKKRTLDDSDSDLSLFEIPIESPPRKRNPTVAVIKPILSNSGEFAASLVQPTYQNFDGGLKNYNMGLTLSKSNHSSRSSSPDIVMFKGKGKQPADPRKRTVVKRSKSMVVETVKMDATPPEDVIDTCKSQEQNEGEQISTAGIHFGSSVAMKREANNKHIIDLTDTPMVIDLDCSTSTVKPIRSPKMQARVAPFKSGVDDDVILVSAESDAPGLSTSRDGRSQEEHDFEYARQLQNAFDNMDSSSPLDQTRESPDRDLNSGASGSRESGISFGDIFGFTGLSQRASRSFHEDVPTGYHKDLIDGLPTHKVKKVSKLDEQDCMICMDQYKPLELVATIPSCRHKFHKRCVAKWLKLKKTCPVCRCEAIY